MHNDRRGANRYDRMASRTKGFTVIFVSYSWATSYSVLNMLPDICRPSRIYAIANCPRSQTWPKTIPPLYIRWMRNMGLRLKGEVARRRSEKFLTRVFPRNLLFSSTLFYPGIVMGSSSMCTHWNQSQIRYKRFASWDSIAYKMIVVDGIFLFVFELYCVDGNNRKCYDYFLSNEEY